MVQALPTDEIKVFKVCDTLDYTSSSSTKGYIYTIDVKYNDELKEKTNKYPFFPERQKLTVISSQTIKMKIKRRNINEKLMLKLTDKNGYVIDGEMLDWYLASGLKLEDIKVKKKLEYSKSEW